MVDEHNHGDTTLGAPPTSVGGFPVGVVRAYGDNDGPLFDELVGYEHRLVEKAAGVVAQVEDEPSGGPLLSEGLQGFFEVSPRVFLEVLDCDVTDTVAQCIGFHSVDFNYVANDGNLFGIGQALPHDTDSNSCARLTPQFPHSLNQVHVHGAFILDLDDLILRPNARSVSRRPLQRGDYSKLPVSYPYDDAEPTKRPLGAEAKFLIDLGGQQHRVRIEALE